MLALAGLRLLRGLARSKLVAVRRIRGRNVEIESGEPRAPRVAYLVAIAVLDQQERSRAQRDAQFVDARHTRAGHDEEPLVGAVVAVTAVAFRVAGFQHQLRRLRAAVAEHHVEASSEPKRLVPHAEPT